MCFDVSTLSQIAYGSYGHLFLTLCDIKLFHFSLSILLWHSDTSKVSQSTMFSRASSYTSLSTVELYCEGLAFCLHCTGPGYPHFHGHEFKAYLLKIA